jgi:hypothetical protein
MYNWTTKMALGGPVGFGNVSLERLPQDVTNGIASHHDVGGCGCEATDMPCHATPLVSSGCRHAHAQSSEDHGFWILLGP